VIACSVRIPWETGHPIGGCRSQKTSPESQDHKHFAPCGRVYMAPPHGLISPVRGAGTHQRILIHRHGAFARATAATSRDTRPPAWSGLGRLGCRCPMGDINPSPWGLAVGCCASPVPGVQLLALSRRAVVRRPHGFNPWRWGGPMGEGVRIADGREAPGTGPGVWDRSVEEDQFPKRIRGPGVWNL
jgi:hypothetical protein